MKEPKVIHVAQQFVVSSGNPKVVVDRFFDEIWLGLSHSYGSAGFHLSIEEAQEVIKALEKAVKEAMET